MNGRDISAAAALFFALLSIGLLLKLDDILISAGGASFCAVLAALMMKKTILQAQQEAEDNHQRLEVQFQQLRSKLSGEQIDHLERHTRLLESISKKLNALEDLNRNDQLSDTLKSTLEQLTEVQSELPSEFEKIVKKFEEQADQSKAGLEPLVKEFSTVGEKISELTEQNAKLIEKIEGLHSVVTTGVKLVQVMGQLMKNPPFAKDVTHLSETLDGLSEKLASIEKLEELEKIHETITENGKSVDEVLDGVRENMMGMTFQFDKSLTEFGERIKALTEETEKLVERIDAYNGLTKATLEQYSMLTEQDVRVLEDLTRKLEVRN